MNNIQRRPKFLDKRGAACAMIARDRAVLSCELVSMRLKKRWISTFESIAHIGRRQLSRLSIRGISLSLFLLFFLTSLNCSRSNINNEGNLSLDLSLPILSDVTADGIRILITPNMDGVIYGVIRTAKESAPSKEEIKLDPLKFELVVMRANRDIGVEYLILRDKLVHLVNIESYTFYLFLEKPGVASGSVMSFNYTPTYPDLVHLGNRTLSQLRTDGFTAAQLATAGFTAAQLYTAGFTLAQLYTAGFNAAQLYIAGFTAAQLRTLGFTAAQLYTAGFNAAQLATAGFDKGAAAARQRADNVSALDLYKRGFDIPDLVIAGFERYEIATALSEIHSGLASKTCSVTKTKTKTETRCIAQLPNMIFDSSERFSGRIPDQSEKYLVQIDPSGLFPGGAANISYKILSGNPAYDYRWTSPPPQRVTRSIQLSAYRINSEGKLYAKDVWLLGRNRAMYNDANERKMFRNKNGGEYTGDYTWAAWRSLCPFLSRGVLNCTNLHYYRYEYTFNRTDIDLLTIEVKNTNTSETHRVTIAVNPNLDAFPQQISSSEETITPAPSTGLSCFSPSSEEIPTCTKNLPLVVHENSERFFWKEQSDNYLIRVDASKAKAFSAPNRLSYKIISGNPSYTYEKTLSSGVKKIVNLSAYAINSEGKIYPKDVWLLGRNQNIYELDKSQLEHILFSPRSGFRSFELARSHCPPIFNSRNINCSGLHNFSMNYTFAKTETDTLRIRVEDMDTNVKRDISVTIKPHPRALSLAEECASNDDLHSWACVNAAPLIPDRQFTTTNAMRNSLPSNLARDRSKYDLVAAVEFNSFDEMENMFTVPASFRASPDTKIVNGKLQLLIKPVHTASGICMYSRNPSVSSHGVFEPGSGYLEYKVTKYPKIKAIGGNVIMWSRYGEGHDAFWLAPPDRIWRSNDRTSVTRGDIGRIGYAEIDYLERWNYFSYPYFVIHTYPLSSTAKLGGLPMHRDTLNKAHYYSSWGNGSSNGDARGANTYSITYGMEISPGHSQAGRTVNFFKNGVRYNRASGTEAYDYVNGGAFKIATISNILIKAKACSSLSSTMIEMDHIRYYRPRDGY